jgi:transaldolase
MNEGRGLLAGSERRRVNKKRISDPQTDAAVEKFTQDWQKVNKQPLLPTE